MMRISAVAEKQLPPQEVLSHMGADLSTRWRLMVSFTLRPLYPWGKIPAVPIVYKSRLSREPVWTFWRREKKISLSLPGIETRPPAVSRRYTDWGIQAPNNYRYCHIFRKLRFLIWILISALFCRASVPVNENSELGAVLSFESTIHCPLAIKHCYIPYSRKCLVK